MEIITWNIQAAKGVDDKVSPVRIAETLRAFGDSDIICLQEVDRTDKSGQFSGLADDLGQLFPEYEMIYGPAVDRLQEECRYQFGNLILSKMPIEFIYMHRLPQPADSTVWNMSRQAIEIIVTYSDHPLRIITTHLEYFATGQRQAQLKYFLEYHKECSGRQLHPAISGEGTYIAPPETERTILCGDFNMEVDDDHYLAFTYGSPYKDAWRVTYGDTRHDPTCGIYDRIQWKNGEHCRDFFFLSGGIEKHINSIEVNTETQASDHQPVKLLLN